MRSWSFLRVEREEQLVERLGHVIHRAGVGRVQDLALDLAVGRGDLDGEVALGDRRRARPAVAVDAHGAQVHQRDVQSGRDDRGEHVVRGAHVVVDRVALGGRVAHRIGRGALLAEVDDRVGARLAQQRLEPVVLLGQVQVHEADLLAGQLLPHANALADGADRRQRLHLELQVDLAATQVVDDGHVPADVRQVQRGGPAAESVATQYENLHDTLLRSSADVIHRRQRVSEPVILPKPRARLGRHASRAGPTSPRPGTRGVGPTPTLP